MNQPDLEIRTWSARHPRGFRKILEYSVIFLLVMAAIVAFRQNAHGDTTTPETYNSPAKGVKPVLAQPVASSVAPISGLKGYTVHPTWFGAECPTKWCKAHIGGEREPVVALNYKLFGKAKAVYVPAFGKTYPVISNTDGLTPIDFWCDTDTACQKQIAGLDTLLINVIR